MKHKIPCSVGIITLNSGKTLKRCLNSIKDLDEIIVCDGNSTDNTIKIAKKYGCKIIPQYNSKQKNIIAKDKSIIRNKTIKTSKHDWYFWIDSDDYASRELVSSIRHIVNSKSPSHLAYQVNCKIKIGNKIIQHSSSYPDSRLMLVNKKTKPFFIKPTHEKIYLDRNKFSIGKLKGNLYLCWDKSRIGLDYWKNANQQIHRDFNQNKNQSFKQFLRSSIYFNLKTTLYFLIKPLFIYIKYGYKDSMPYSVEIKRAQYHTKLLLKHLAYRLKITNE